MSHLKNVQIGTYVDDWKSKYYNLNIGFPGKCDMITEEKKVRQ